MAKAKKKDDAPTPTTDTTPASSPAPAAAAPEEKPSATKAEPPGAEPPADPEPPKWRPFETAEIEEFTARGLVYLGPGRPGLIVPRAPGVEKGYRFAEHGDWCELNNYIRRRTEPRGHHGFRDLVEYDPTTGDPVRFQWDEKTKTQIDTKPPKEAPEE